ncbi:Uncharacterised protein [Bacteroides xylanisolvens]|nr:Uncharacterised protein [Bacteroides xylanisolvens]
MVVGTRLIIRYVQCYVIRMRNGELTAKGAKIHRVIEILAYLTLVNIDIQVNKTFLNNLTRTIVHRLRYNIIRAGKQGNT